MGKSVIVHLNTALSFCLKHSGWKVLSSHLDAMRIHKAETALFPSAASVGAPV